MINSKRSLAYSQLAVIILILVATFILLNWAGLFSNLIKKGGDIEVCRLSVWAQAQTKLMGSTPLKLNCDRRQVEFYNEKVEINGKEEAKFEFKQLSNDIVSKVIAEELRLCWYMMGEGETDVFEQAMLIGNPQSVCAICSEIIFDDKIDRNKKFAGLIDYLKSNKIQGKDMFYFDYLVRSQRNRYLLWGNIAWSQYTPWGWGTTNNLPQKAAGENSESNLKNYNNHGDLFDPQKTYVIYFLSHKPNWAIEKTRAVTSSYYIGLGEPSKAAIECERLVN